jgi:hypothetical protein
MAKKNKKSNNKVIVYSEMYESFRSKILSSENNCEILLDELTKNKIKGEVKDEGHIFRLVVNKKDYHNANKLLLMTGLDFFRYYYENYNKEII